MTTATEMTTTRVAGGEEGGGPEDPGAVTALLGHLDTWDKLLVVAGAVSQSETFIKTIDQSAAFILTIIVQVAALGLAVFLLVCCVGKGCLLHDVISRRSEYTVQCAVLSTVTRQCYH